MTSFHRDILLKSIWMSSARHDAWISSSCSMVRAGATITMGDGSVFVVRRWGKTRNFGKNSPWFPGFLTVFLRVEDPFKCCKVPGIVDCGGARVPCGREKSHKAGSPET